MKTLTYTLPGLIITAILIGATPLASQCPDHITFSRQGEIDSFAIHYPGCTEIFGNVSFHDNNTYNIENLDSLVQLQVIHGDLRIRFNYGLQSLDGLLNLTHIGGSLDVEGNIALVTIEGLSSIEYVGGDVGINNNLSLEDITALEKLTDIQGELYIRENRLTSLQGIHNVVYIGDDLVISESQLADLEPLSNIEYIGRHLGINNVHLITDFSDLGNLSYVGGGFGFGECNGLMSVQGLDNLHSTGEGLYVLNNASLTDLSGFENFDSLGVILDIAHCPSLTSLHGLENLTFAGSVVLEKNQALTDITALSNVTAIDGGIHVLDNSSLQSLEGLGQIDPSTITWLEINDSPNLTDCAVKSICLFLRDTSGVVEISNNGPGCNSIEEILAICDSLHVSTRIIYAATPLSIHPNPATESITIDSAPDGPVLIFDALGNLIYQTEKSKEVIDVRHWPAGFYSVMINDSQRQYSGRFVKQ